MPLDESLLACGNAPIDDRSPWTLALAATEQEVGLAWVSRDPSGGDGLHFGRFATDLTLIEEKGPFGPSCPGHIAIAARPGGWSLAVEASDGLHLLALSANGDVTADLRVQSHTSSLPWNLALRDGAEPILMWTERSGTPVGTDDLHVARVNTDGSSLAPDTIVKFPFPLGEISAVAAGDGWLLAAEAGSARSIHIAPLAADGMPAGPMQAPFDPKAVNPRMTASPTGPRMTFYNGAERYFVALTNTGVPIGAPVPLAPTPRNSVEAPVTAFGGDTVALLPTSQEFLLRGWAKWLEIVRLDANGAPTGASKTVVADPQVMQAYAMVRRGPEVVLAWVNGREDRGNPGLGPMSIGMARLAP
jgi:hypothetical protein